MARLSSSTTTTDIRHTDKRLNNPPEETYTARELLALPRAEQYAILTAQTEVAAKAYAQHPELMEFTIS